jgi:hypothetical protein
MTSKKPWVSDVTHNMRSSTAAGTGLAKMTSKKPAYLRRAGYGEMRRGTAYRPLGIGEVQTYSTKRPLHLQ